MLMNFKAPAHQAESSGSGLRRSDSMDSLASTANSFTSARSSLEPVASARYTFTAQDVRAGCSLGMAEVAKQPKNFSLMQKLKALYKPKDRVTVTRTGHPLTNAYGTPKMLFAKRPAQVYEAVAIASDFPLMRELNAHYKHGMMASVRTDPRFAGWVDSPSANDQEYYTQLVECYQAQMEHDLLRAK